MSSKDSSQTTLSVSVIIGASYQVLPCIVLDQDPRKESSDNKLVVFRIVDKNPVIKVGLQIEVVEVYVFFVFISEGVAHPEVY